MKRLKGPAAALVAALFVTSLGLSIALADLPGVIRPVDGAITVNLIPIQASADINGDGTVDAQDLTDLASLLGTGDEAADCRPSAIMGHI